MTIVGEEYLNLKIDTPSFDSPIWKTFRCCGVEGRTFTRDTTTESYVIHFVSPEVFLDHYTVVQSAFEGNADDIVEEIFRKYLIHPRHLTIKDETLTDSENPTELSIFTECKTKVKFISPSWSPMKCLSWLASKVRSSDSQLKAANFMFFETNKKFYWGSLEDIIKAQRDTQTLVGIYVYAPGDVKNTEENHTTISVGQTLFKSPDLTRDFFSVHDLNISNNINILNNLQSGYLASVHHELDVTSKTYTETIYDHVIKYPDYKHTSANAKGFFADEAVRSPYAHQIVRFKHSGLFDSIPNNLNESAKDVMPIRNSLLAEMDQIKMKISVHGRTDIELGSMMYLLYPKSGPKIDSDKNKSIQDEKYSGLYIITAIHHVITLENHTMTMEIIKDSFGDVNEGKGA
jgi:hypothetical protein